MRDINLRRFFLYLLIGSVGISTLLGIIVILIGNFGEFETKILLTALTVTVTSIFGLACGAYLETGRAKILPAAGIALAVIAAVMWIIMIWSGRITNDLYVRSLMSATVGAAACSHVSLLSLARLRGRLLWSRYAVHATVALLTLALFYVIWDRRAQESELIGRVLGVLSVIVASLTVVTPIFHKLSHAVDHSSEIDLEIANLRKRIEELKEKKRHLSLPQKQSD